MDGFRRPSTTRFTYPLCINNYNELYFELIIIGNKLNCLLKSGLINPMPSFCSSDLHSWSPRWFCTAFVVDENSMEIFRRRHFFIHHHRSLQSVTSSQLLFFSSSAFDKRPSILIISKRSSNQNNYRYLKPFLLSFETIKTNENGKSFSFVVIGWQGNSNKWIMLTAGGR
jgi:hypothetical protein